MKSNAIPSFGPLQGYKVVHLTQSVAGPYCANMMAQFGANVIWIESPKGIDVMRPTRWCAELERRNMRSICLDTPSEKGKEVFLKLIKDADVVLDSFKGRQMAQWGITDELMHEINPGLVIAHVSGYGQSGDPTYVAKPSYDPLAQAFGCYMQHNGYPDRQPVPAFPFAADYMTSLQTGFAIMAALYRRNITGIGEVIDSAQYENMMSVQGNQVCKYLNTGVEPVREGCHSLSCAGYGAYTCKDGIDIYTLILGIGVYAKAIPFLGLEFSEDLPKGQVAAFPNTKGWDILEEALQKYCDEHTALEVEVNFNKVGIPCMRIFDYTMAVDHPHYKAREVFIEWENATGDTVKGVNVFPKLKNNPGKIWRGLMTIGQDTPDILEELGYSADEIAAMQAEGIAVKK